jgi:hypothetical protein
MLESLNYVTAKGTAPGPLPSRGITFPTLATISCVVYIIQDYHNVFAIYFQLHNKMYFTP